MIKKRIASSLFVFVATFMWAGTVTACSKQGESDCGKLSDEIRKIMEIEEGDKVDLAKLAEVAPKYGALQPFENPETIRSRDGFLDTTLELKYGDNRIAECDVHLRSYNGGLVGPTLRVKPGHTMRILLKNMLPEDKEPPEDHNIPHGFNTTNFHTHGLHVSPVGNSDNVLLKIKPGQEFQFEIKVPRDHPPGTFWYHAHSHGSTALQVSSGMGGALIIEGGLDEVKEIAAAKERIFVFQQIAYDTTGKIENYDDFGPTKWKSLGRQTTINGLLVPVIKMKPGEVQRWRFIHAGVRETINVHLEGHQLHEIAVDGIALGKIDTWKIEEGIELQPGYRSDVLVQAQKVRGAYLLVDGALPENETLHAVEEVAKILAVVKIEGEDMDMELPLSSQLAEFLPFKDISQDEITGTQEIRFNIDTSGKFPQGPEKFSIDLEFKKELDDMRVSKAIRQAFKSNGASIPKNSVVDVEQKDRQWLIASKGYDSDLGYRIRRKVNSLGVYDPSKTKTGFLINDEEFSLDNVRKVKLGDVEEWRLSSGFVNHPFHIHVNPFQHTRIGPDGKAEKIWRDTLLVHQKDKDGNPAKPVKIFTRYTRYIGKFVLHCHILDHEDQGMMEVVEVVMPD